MKIKSIILFLTCLLLLSSFTAPATACCKPPAPPCHHCEDTVWVSDCDSADCEECVDGVCEVCDDDPNQVCCDGTCCDTDLCYDCNSTTGECEYQCDPNLCEECDGNGVCEVCGGDTSKCCDSGTCVTSGYCNITLVNMIQDCSYDGELGSYDWCCCSLHFGHCTSTLCDTCEESDWLKICSGGAYESYAVEEGRHCGDNPDCSVVDWRPVNKIGDMICYITCQQCCIE